MAIIPILSQGSDSNSYLIIDDKTMLIDPGAGLDERIAREVNSELDGRSLDMIVNTHAHFDHCVGNDKFHGAKVHIHRDDAQELLRGSFYGTYQFFDEEFPIKFHKLLVGRDKIDLGHHVLEIIHTPGHTPGGICLYEKDEGFLFSGDTLFPDGGFGRLDMGGDQAHMIQSLDKITKLEFDVLYPGHGPVVPDGKKHAEASLQNAKMFTS